MGIHFKMSVLPTCPTSLSRTKLLLRWVFSFAVHCCFISDFFLPNWWFGMYFFPSFGTLPFLICMLGFGPVRSFLEYLQDLFPGVSCLAVNDVRRDALMSSDQLLLICFGFLSSSLESSFLFFPFPNQLHPSKSMTVAQVEGCPTVGWPPRASHRMVEDNDSSETKLQASHPPLLSRFLPYFFFIRLTGGGAPTADNWSLDAGRSHQLLLRSRFMFFLGNQVKPF